MAEINIEKKKPIWPWIILVLVILGILYFVFFSNGENGMDDQETTTEEMDTVTGEDERNETSIGADTMGVAAYLSYVEDEERMGRDHEYTNTALLRLISAVQAKADEMNYDISADMQSIRQDAEKITNDPTATDHANSIKNAGQKIVDVLEGMQQENFPELSQDVQEARDAVQNIDTSTQTLEQRDQVKSFFSETADVLRKMS